jgi:hypothetical protein
VGGLSIAMIGMTWMSRLSLHAPYFPDIVGPLVLLGVGMGLAFTPLTTAGIAGVDPSDAGAASGLVNAAQQLGGSVGLSALVTVFAAAGRSAMHHPLIGASAETHAHYALTHAVASAITGSAVFLAGALVVSLIAVARPTARGTLAFAEPLRG